MNWNLWNYPLHNVHAFRTKELNLGHLKNVKTFKNTFVYNFMYNWTASCKTKWFVHCSWALFTIARLIIILKIAKVQISLLLFHFITALYAKERSHFPLCGNSLYMYVRIDLECFMHDVVHYCALWSVWSELYKLYKSIQGKTINILRTKCAMVIYICGYPHICKD